MSAFLCAYLTRDVTNVFVAVTADDRVRIHNRMKGQSTGTRRIPNDSGGQRLSRHINDHTRV